MARCRTSIKSAHFVRCAAREVKLIATQMGFFAMVGPLQVFVSSHVSPFFLALSLSPPLPFPLSYHDEPLHRDNRLPMLIYAGRSCSN